MSAGAVSSDTRAIRSQVLFAAASPRSTDPSTVIPNTTFNKLWRAHAHNAWVNEIACWTDTGTVILTIRRSDGNLLNATPLTCSTSGASTTALANQSVDIGTDLGFTTASASSVKNLSVSIKYVRWH